jgi:hypothetical protein
LATDRPKRGDHRFHLAVATADRSSVHSLTLAKGQRDRAGEEAVLVAVLLNALAEAVGVTLRLPLPLLEGECLAVDVELNTDPIAALVARKLTRACVTRDGRIQTNGSSPAALLPGSFNPVHCGHWGLAEVAASLLGKPVAFELSVANVDKPPLAVEEARRRANQFLWKSPLWLTQAPTFMEKASLFASTVFVVGVDTAERIVQPRYYGDNPDRMAGALESIRNAGCRFLVAGREDSAGHFQGLEDVAIPSRFRDLFEGIPEEAFRVAVSSTALRERVPVAAGPSSP